MSVLEVEVLPEVGKIYCSKCRLITRGFLASISILESAEYMILLSNSYNLHGICIDCPLSSGTRPALPVTGSDKQDGLAPAHLRRVGVQTLICGKSRRLQTPTPNFCLPCNWPRHCPRVVSQHSRSPSHCRADCFFLSLSFLVDCHFLTSPLSYSNFPRLLASFLSTLLLTPSMDTLSGSTVTIDRVHFETILRRWVPDSCTLSRPWRGSLVSKSSAFQW